MSKIIILSLGGSLIFPDGLDKKFLTNFKNVILKYIKKRYKFVIICGGGKLARNFQQVASKSRKLSSKKMDWLGIYATKINAHLLKSVFNKHADENIISNPNLKIKFRKNIIIAAGWLPGWSTDYDAVLLAKNLSIKEIINMSNVDYVYDRDPRKYGNAKKIEKISWKDYSKLISHKWQAGMNVPFDPIAAKEARKSRIRVNIIGKDLKNLENLLDGKKFKGTIIQ
ncbi:MAG: UMP kinase [Nanoarchaeota archaeon]|nr:UMP kinase [Nanoarchaeota archaeon]